MHRGQCRRRWFNSAASLRDYVLSPQGLALPSDHLLWLFNEDSSASQLDIISSFLSAHAKMLDKERGRGIAKTAGATVRSMPQNVTQLDAPGLCELATPMTMCAPPAVHGCCRSGRRREGVAALTLQPCSGKRRCALPAGVTDCRPFPAPNPPSYLGLKPNRVGGRFDLGRFGMATPADDLPAMLDSHEVAAALGQSLGIVKLFENACGAVDVSCFGGQMYWLTVSFMPLQRL